MSGNTDPGDIFDGGGAGEDFANAEKRAEWARNKTKLAIVGAKPKYTSKFGERTTFILKVGGEKWQLDLGHTEARKDQADAVLERLATGAAYVGPVYLKQERSNAGNLYWTLSGVPGDGTVEAAPTDDFAPADDGIPF